MVTALDTRIILGLRAALPGVTLPMQALSWTATGGGAVPAAIIIGVLLGRLTSKRQGWFYVVTCLAGWGANLVLKEFLHRVRPQDVSPRLTAAGWYSYPSGHAMMAILVFGFGAWLLAPSVASRGWRAVLLVVAALLTIGVGISRIYLGAHWPSDVLGAWLAGAAWAALCLRWEERRAPKSAA
ncbi:MAG TPA: phosphatase PAP2 family protein [Gemmatimonadales bacterium]